MKKRQHCFLRKNSRIKIVTILIRMMGASMTGFDQTVGTVSSNMVGYVSIYDLGIAGSGAVLILRNSFFEMILAIMSLL